MKIYALCILYKGVPNATILKASYEMQSFGYFQRGSAKEFMAFTSKIITERTQKGMRASVREQEYNCHVYVRTDSLSGVAVCDTEYPPRVAFTLLSKILDQFASEVPAGNWPTLQESDVTFTALEPFLAKYQNPKEADAMTRLQSDLDETKVIMHSTIESMLERGEKLDDLVSKSDALSAQSKTFYKTAKKTNSCCVIQ